MFSEKYLNFHFPLFTTCLHMLVQFSLASLVLYFIPRLRPRTDSLSNPGNHYHVRQETSEIEKPLMTKMFYFTRVGPCGAATGLDIGLGNMSLKFITLTFYSTLIKGRRYTYADNLSLSNVQVLFPSIRPSLRIPISPRRTVHQTGCDYHCNDNRRHHDGGW